MRSEAWRERAAPWGVETLRSAAYPLRRARIASSEAREESKSFAMMESETVRESWAKRHSCRSARSWQARTYSRFQIAGQPIVAWQAA